MVNKVLTERKNKSDNVAAKCCHQCTDLIEEQDEVQSKGDEQRQEPKVVEIARKIVLGGGGGRGEGESDMGTAQTEHRCELTI